MPAEESSEERRDRPLPTILFWGGVGLAVLSALLLLLAQGSVTLRLAAVLAIFSVVSIGLSLTLRSDPESVRAAMEESLIEEIEELRTDLRKDIETAARATHKAFGEKLQVLQNEVRAIRTQVVAEPPAGSARAQPSATAGSARAQPSATAGSARVAAGAARVTTGSARVTTGPAGATAGTAPVTAPPFDARQAAPVTGSEAGRSGPPERGGPNHGFGPHPHMPTGVVRHTETVKVTTRQTIVGGMPDDGRRAAGYDTGAAPVVSAGPYRSGPSDAEAYDLGGAEAGRYGTQPADYGRHRDGGADQGWPGGRWASARRDAWGSQVRMGERHAALRADESGSELHVADRWSSVHHYEQPGVHHYEQPAGRHGRPAEPEGVYAAVRAHDEPGRSARHRRDPQHSSDAGWFPSGAEDGRYGRQPVESGWADPAWASAPPDYPRRDDHARYDSGGGGNGGEWYGYPPADEVPRAGGARSTDLYPADGRWR